MEPVKRRNNTNPEKNASPISKLFFFWTRSIFYKGYRKTLSESDLYDVLDCDKSDYLGDKLEANWNKELAISNERKEEPSLQRAIVKTFWKSYMICIIIALINNLVVRILLPILMGKVIQYFTQGNTIDKTEAILYGVGLIAFLFIRLMFDHHYNNLCGKLGMRVRVACCSIIYRKLLRLSKCTTDQTATGRIVNIMSNDVSRFNSAAIFLGYLIITPLQIIVITYCLWLLVGPSALVGVAFNALQIIPVQTYLGKVKAKLRKNVAILTDYRMRLMNEIVSGIQVIKMYTWEIPFSKFVTIARRKEMWKIRHSSYLSGFYLSSMFYLDRSTLFVTLLCYVLMGFDITPQQVFSMTQFYITLNLTVTIMFPPAIEFKEEVSVSIKRIQELLMQEEGDCSSSYSTAKQLDGKNNGKPNGTSPASISIMNTSARWATELVRDNLRNINFEVPEGKLCAVIGPVGSGKSSILQVIMKELPIYNGSVSVGGSISYASQEPWIFVGTVRQNILFGQPYREEKYKEVVRICALQKDFDMFPRGDRSFVGEKGITLSGGQKARINLARAVYRSADVYLLDDPLSAVDTHVGKHLFNECIKTHLGNKTRILVTHQLQYIKDADLVIILNNGEIENQGTFTEMQKSGLNFAKLLAKEENESEEEKEMQQIFERNRFISNTSNSENDSDFFQRCFRKDDISIRFPRKGRFMGGSCRKHRFQMNSFTNYNYQARETRSVQKRHMSLPSLISTNFVIKKGMYNTSDSKGFSKSPTKGSTLWNGSTKIRGILKNIIRNRSSLQTCANVTCTGCPIKKSKETKNHTNRKSSASSCSRDESDLPDEENVESRTTGVIKWRTYWQYFHAGAGSCCLFWIAFMFILSQVLASGIDYWTAFWTNEEVIRQTYRQALKIANETNSTVPPDVVDNTKVDKQNSLIIFGVLIACCIFLTLFRSILFLKICMEASVRLHNAMFMSILRGTMRFFDTNPSGRILNRFSQDIGTIDELLPRTMLPTIQVLLVMVGVVANIIIVNPYFSIPMAVLLFFYYGVTTVYLSTSRNVKRLEGIARSPIYTHVSDTMNGLTTLRVSGAQEMVRNGFESRQDNHIAAMSLFVSTSCAFMFWMDVFSSLFVSVITLTFYLLEDNIGAKVGLALSQALMVTGRLPNGLQRSTEVVSQMTSVERVLEYTNIEKEPPLESAPEKKPDLSWPSKGAIEFDHLYLKYAENHPHVLKNLYFRIEPTHKVGIVGRTGAGKSSLISALFRLAKLDGAIKIDGINTNDLGLHDLRSRISIIPQEPVLFYETLRHNLDPFNHYSDDALWNSLEEVDLKAAVAGLDMQVQEGGSNFSVGQRQLICLARAILRNNKILVLDEATANVDPETDMLVQETIRRKFKYCTVLTIAHRLNTIMDSDRVLVMDSGSMVEYDHPHKLLQNRNGYFYKLVQETGPAMADQLNKIAGEAYQKTSQRDGAIREDESSTS